MNEVYFEIDQSVARPWLLKASHEWSETTPAAADYIKCGGGVRANFLIDDSIMLLNDATFRESHMLIHSPLLLQL